MTLDRSELSEEWQRAFDFVEAQVGGRVVAAERQARWRPAYFLDVEREGGEIVPVYFRGARGEADHGVYQLRTECTWLELLEKHGIPVPHVYGFCPDPEGIVMDKAPGRANLATADSEEERRAVIDHYMELLVQIHGLPLDDFVAAGAKRPTTPEALALGDLAAWVGSYRKAKKRPEPLIEFGIDWLERNVPAGRERASFLTGDSGQFLFDGGRVTAVIDVELAYIGDPAADLGGMLNRDLSEPLGDLSYAVRRYEEISGETVDRRVVHYHAVRFGMVTPLATASIVAAPPLVADYVQYLIWYLVYARCPLEIIAHLEGVEIPAAELPTGLETDYSVGHDALRDRLAAFERGDSFKAYQLEAVERLATYLSRADRYGPALEADDLDEAAELLGRRPASGAERDAALEELVAANTGDLDAALLRYFVHRTQRQEFLLQPVAKELEGARMQIIASA
jgi:hypothetical protein